MISSAHLIFIASIAYAGMFAAGHVALAAPVMASSWLLIAFAGACATPFFITLLVLGHRIRRADDFSALVI